MDWVHFITRGNLHVRWNLDNTMMMHNGCHNNWAHKYKERFDEFMQKKLGDRYWLLRRASNDSSKLDYDAIRLCLELKLKEATENEFQ